ncbi:MAG TPA: hypothetical protein VLK78_05165 [Candidatus Angelobacter sp.]|nr:hypothetical protein [Candidatus Angelobacter sp.]
MDLRDSLHHELIGQMDSSLIINHLLALLRLKQDEVNLLKDKIIKYEQKSRAEDVFYQSLSPIRKLFTSRPPTHHRAVEYLVNVKDRMKKIERLNEQASELRMLLLKLEENSPKELILPPSILEDLRPFLSKKEMFQS